MQQLPHLNQSNQLNNIRMRCLSRGRPNPSDDQRRKIKLFASLVQLRSNKPLKIAEDKPNCRNHLCFLRVPTISESLRFFRGIYEIKRCLATSGEKVSFNSIDNSTHAVISQLKIFKSISSCLRHKSHA